jgi:exopolyphosphatase/guanosine-5'-triphosphate,3'-diphosphate pyrophosphatase
MSVAESTASIPTEAAAVVQFGATSVTLLVGERSESGVFSGLDYLEKPLPLARDIFRDGSVSRQTMEQAASILREFQQTLHEYGVAPSATKFFTTNILAEAVNHEIFLNRMQVTSGARVDLIDDGDMTRLIYQTTVRLLNSNPQIAQANTLVSHIGPGNTRALYFKKGRIAAYSSYRLGIFRAREAVAQEESGSSSHLMHIEEHIRGVVDHLATDYTNLEVDYHVAIGTEIQSIAPHVAAPKQGASFIPLKDLARFTEKIAAMSSDEMVRELHLHYTGSEGMLAALQTNMALARRFNDRVLVVPEGDFQRDLLLDLLSNNPQTKTFQDDVMQAAKEIGKKYKIDYPHSGHVANFAQQIYRELQDLHGLDPKYELLLRVAATLHEVGLFVSPREHHKHSLYLILNTEIFGLSVKDRTLVALLARYHRRYNPDPNHPHFSDLSREERMTVFKLAAILRIADCLDRSHSQRVKSIRLERDGDIFRIITSGVEDTTVEQLAISGKCDIFQEIYGYEIELRK